MLILLQLLKANWRLLVVALAVSAYTYYWYSFGYDVNQAKHDKAEAAAIIEANQRSAALEVELAAQRAKNAKVNAKLRSAINENADYSKCRLTPNGLLVLREAISAR